MRELNSGWPCGHRKFVEQYGVVTSELHVSDVVAPPPTISHMIGRAARLQCPRCGAGELFHHWFHMVPRCGGCGYRFKRVDGFILGAFTLNMFLTLLSLFFVLVWVIFREASNIGSSLVPPMAVGAVLATVLPVAFYPMSYTLWAVFDLASDPLELVEIVAAVDAIEANERHDATESTTTP